jgi:hypothetical protein
MYGETECLLSRYEAEQDRLEMRAAAAKAADAEAEQAKADEFVDALAKGINAKLASTMFPQVKDIFYDLAGSSDSFLEACFSALILAERRGDIAARTAMDRLQAHYMRVA